MRESQKDSDNIWQDTAEAKPLLVQSLPARLKGSWANFFAGPRIDDDFLNVRKQPELPL